MGGTKLAFVSVTLKLENEKLGQVAYLGTLPQCHTSVSVTADVKKCHSSMKIPNLFQG